MVEGARRRERPPRPLAQAVAQVRASLTPPTLLARAQSCWAEAAGEAVAEQAVPVSERGGVITIACRSATWASELNLLAESLLASLNEALAEGVDGASGAKALKFVVRPS
jgi:predicted nucleic acid-binding Zn ribbon protein